jgi:rhodanese-related sulfurtransferase
MSLPAISPAEAKRLIEEGALLIDIRGADEHARERIPGARNVPLDRLTSLQGEARALVFHCRSGHRTTVNAGRLAEAAGCEAYVVEGGIESWKRAGLPVITNRRQPIEIMRQVQLAAGGLVLVGILLSSFVNPAFLAVSVLVGAGQILSGVTGWCGMAELLKRMPWNQSQQPA